MYASLVLDSPCTAFAQWDPDNLNLHLLDKQGHGPLPTLELGITNIGSGVARKVEISFLFHCEDLKGIIKRSGIFKRITGEITDSAVILLSRRVATDMDDATLHGIEVMQRKYEYKIEGSDESRILEPTKSNTQKWQLKVELPSAICRALLLYCAASFVEITKKSVGDVGERIQVMASGSLRDVGSDPMADTWGNYKHVLPSLIVDLKYSDDFRNRYQSKFEIPATFICMPNLAIGKDPRPRAMHVQLKFSHAREVHI